MMALDGICLDFSIDEVGASGFYKEDHRDEVLFSHHISSTYYQHAFSLLILTFPLPLGSTRYCRPILCISCPSPITSYLCQSW